MNIIGMTNVPRRVSPAERDLPSPSPCGHRLHDCWHPTTVTASQIVNLVRNAATISVLRAALGETQGRGPAVKCDRAASLVTRSRPRAGEELTLARPHHQAACGGDVAADISILVVGSVAFDTVGRRRPRGEVLGGSASSRWRLRSSPRELVGIVGRGFGGGRRAGGVQKNSAIDSRRAGERAWRDVHWQGKYSTTSTRGNGARTWQTFPSPSSPASQSTQQQPRVPRQHRPPCCSGTSLDQVHAPEVTSPATR
jgi:hypothetical protein